MRNLFRTLTENGKSADFTITSNGSKRVESQEELKHKPLEYTHCGSKATQKQEFENHIQAIVIIRQFTNTASNATLIQSMEIRDMSAASVAIVLVTHMC